MKINYVKFTSMSIKARMHLIQDRLIELGYNVEVTCKRDRQTVKALMDFQKINGITTNGIVCENTYNKLFRK